MKRFSIAAAIALALFAFVGAVEARPVQAAQHCDNDGRCTYSAAADHAPAAHRSPRTHSPRHVAGDPRPARWCMWWLRHELRIPKSAFRPYEYNLARAGRYIGAPASGPAVGTIVVWPHHVGIITARAASGWIVKSGNDGGAVRERERSLRGAIAFRWPHGRFASR